jgi:hypothetical protein
MTSIRRSGIERSVNAARAGAVLFLAASFVAAVGYSAIACSSTVITTPEIDASTDAAPDAVPDASPPCEWDLPDGGHVVCPADSTTECPAPDGCNICWCNPDDENPQCSELPC